MELLDLSTIFFNTIKFILEKLRKVSKRSSNSLLFDSVASEDDLYPCCLNIF